MLYTRRSGMRHYAPVAKCPPIYTYDDWDFNNKVKFQISRNQELLAERVVEKSRRVIDETNDTTKSWQREVEHHLRERASQIRFFLEQLSKQKKSALLEEEAFLTYRARVLNALEFLKDKSLAICQRCLIFRESRLGVDLCVDEVDRQLQRELKTIRSCQNLLEKVLKETTEQIRKLRAAMYLLDEDLMQKDRSLLIDERNLTLRDTQLNLGRGQNLSQHHCQYSLCEWQHTSDMNIEKNTKLLVKASEFREYVDLSLKQVCEDIQNQTDRTNEAFERRISDIKNAKHCLELKHSDTMRHINEVNMNISHLEAKKGSKQRPMTLCQIRLSNRAQRPGLELTCDKVQYALYHEFEALQCSMRQLNEKVNENKASLRYLLHVQMMQEEDINIKANSIKIDEVDCLSVRTALKYQSF